MDIELFSEAEQSIVDLINDYKTMEKQQIGTDTTTQAASDFIERVKILA